MAATGVYLGGMDNDGIHKFAYRLRAMFADLLRLAVPALAAELDFARAELLPTSHVAPTGARFKQRHGDLTWLVPHRRDAGSHPRLVAVVEFQSTVDQSMAERMREYCRMLRESPQPGSARGLPLARKSPQPGSTRGLPLAGKSPQPGSARGLPLAGKNPQPRQLAGGPEAGRPALLPLVVYNGSERWTAPGAVAELPAQWSAAAQLTLAPFQAWDYVLLSLERLLVAGGGSLAHLPLANRSAATLRLQTELMPENLLARLQQEWVRFPGEADRPTREVLHAWAGALLADMAGAESALPTVNELDGLEGPTGGTEMTTVSQARMGKWFDGVRAEFVAQGIQQGVAQGIQQGVAQGIQQGVAQGIQQGVAQGIQQERARGLARLRRQAAIKFGTQTAERLAARLGTAVSTEQMERVGDWIMECERGGDLLARVAAMRPNGSDES